MDFSVTHILFDLAVILLATKLCGLTTRHFGIPQVVGMIFAGFLIGPAIFSQLNIPFMGIINPSEAEMDTLHAFSQVGVCLILFSSGLETKFENLKKSGFAATIIALFGVAVPLVLGTLGATLFMGGFSSLSNPDLLHNALFVGCILTATSVGITVEALRELGKLSTKVGTVILSAAIIDDVIGIMVLSVLTSLKGGSNVWMTVLKILGFFAFTIVIGLLCRVIFLWLSKNRPHKRRTSIFAFGICFLFAFYAEEYFGVAAITGAYMAGLMLSGLNDTAFMDRKALVSGYMIFTPIFFAYIGISADFSQFNAHILLFALLFIVLGIVAKIGGCGLSAKMCGYSLKESTIIGCGMIARGEIALAVYAAGRGFIAKAADGTLIGIDPLMPTICLIIVSSILCPILVKASYGYSRKKKYVKEPLTKEEEEYRSDISWLFK
ncbi:MAG: cation:proton antiporter [Clostridia bacterium]|nr:cation:proton antiporter [Clostridia bacterium]